MVMRHLLISLTILSLTGCVSNVGNTQEYRGYLNKTLQTRIETAIVMRDAWRGSWNHMFSDPTPMPHLVSRSKVMRNDKLIAIFPVGTQATIHRIEFYNGMDYYWYQAEIELLTDIKFVDGPLLLHWSRLLTPMSEPIFGLPISELPKYK